MMKSFVNVPSGSWIETFPCKLFRVKITFLRTMIKRSHNYDFNCVDYLRWQNNSWEAHIDKISQHVGGNHGNTWKEHMKNFEEVLRHPSLRGKTFVPKKTFQIRTKNIFFLCRYQYFLCAGTEPTSLRWNWMQRDVPSRATIGRSWRSSSISS